MSGLIQYIILLTGNIILMSMNAISIDTFMIVLALAFVGDRIVDLKGAMKR